MRSASNKDFRIEKNQSMFTSTLVGSNTGQPSLHTKIINKQEETFVPSNLLFRYSAQQNFQPKNRMGYQDFENYPKSQHSYKNGNNDFLAYQQVNNIKERYVKNFIPAQIKRKSTVITTQTNSQYQISPSAKQKRIKRHKQTCFTHKNQNIITESKSQKSIRTFFHNSPLNKFQQSFSFKPKSILKMKKQFNQKFNINRFDIIWCLGQGKFAKVFLAVQKQTGFLTALKVVQKNKIIKNNFLNQFIRQIKIQAYLNHPHIVSTYGFFYDQNYFYSIMELGESGQLYDIMKSGQTLSEGSTSFIIGHLLQAISYMHNHRILHRDIKPENIVLVHGIVKLCDFGWAVYTKADLRNTFCGTPLYLSPELLNGQKYDQKIDLWALGILAFQLHVGASPFRIESQQDLINIITNHIEYPKNSNVSQNFKQFIELILQKNPKQRLDANKLLQIKFIWKYRELQTCDQLCQ